MGNCLRWCICGIIVLGPAGLVGLVMGDEKAAGPASATRPAKPDRMTVTVKEVSGAAQYLQSGKDQRWADLKAGLTLDEMTVIRTGFRTRVVLAFADNSVVTIDRATKMGISRFRREGAVTTTRLGLKYGSLRTTVEKARGPNDFSVSTPVATLAVTGSDGLSRFSGDFGFEMSCSSGTWDVKKGSKTRRLKGTESTNNNLDLPITLAKRNATPQMGDAFGGLTPVERNYLTNYGGGRGLIGFTPTGGRTRVVVSRPVSLRPISIYRDSEPNYEYADWD